MPIDAIPIALKSLPVIVAGPIVRRLTRTQVSVWVALTEPDDITLRVELHSAGSTSSSNVTVEPSKVGANVWIAVLTADAPDGEFVTGKLYEYELSANWDSTPGREIDWEGEHKKVGGILISLRPPILSHGDLGSYSWPPETPVHGELQIRTRKAQHNACLTQ